MKYRFCFAVIILLLFSPLIACREQYLCVCEHATGFRYSESSRSWESTPFKAGFKYIISKSDDEKYSFKATEVGEKHPTFTCEKAFNEWGYLFCEDFPGEFKFNKNNGRFLRSYLIGYYNVLPKIDETLTDKNSDTPFIEIGVCSPF